MIKMSRKAKKAMAVALTAGMLASTAATPVMAATAGWKQNAKGWWYENADGTYPANKWQSINGKWYYFDANGYMLSGWHQIPAGGKWYYFGGANDGAMRDGWFKDTTGKWSYAEPGKGAIYLDGWKQEPNGDWYYLDPDGYMQEGGWAETGNRWYFLRNDGVMQTGIIDIEGEVFYLNEDGDMFTGEKVIDGVTYTFDSYGKAIGEKIPTATKAFKKDGTPVAIKEEERALAITSVTAITKNEAGDFVLTALLSETATVDTLKDTTLTLVNGSIVVTAKYSSVDGAFVTYKITDASKLTPGDSSANGSYVVTANGIDVATATLTAAYEETLVGNAVQGIVYYEKAANEYVPIAGATVKVGNKEVTTDTNGYYSIASTSGIATVKVTAAGYFENADENVNVSRNYPSAKNIKLNKYAQEALYINGTVVDEKTSAPVNGAVVELQKKNASGEYEKLAELTTTADGEFVFVNNKTTATSHGYTLDTATVFDFTDDKTLSEDDTYKVVISKDYNANNVNLYEAYHKAEYAVEMNQYGAQTNLKTKSIKPVAKLESASLSMSWVSDIAPTSTADLKVQFIDVDGEKELATVDFSGLAVDKNALKDEKNLIAAAGTLFAKAPTLPTGNYALVVTDMTASSKAAKKVIVVKVTEGGEIKASGEFKEATNGNLKTSVTKLKYEPIVKTLYTSGAADKTASVIGEVVSENAAAYGSEKVKVTYKVYQEAKEMKDGKVLVYTTAASPDVLSYTYEANDALSVEAGTGLSKLEAGVNYICVPTSEYVTATSITVSNDAVGNAFNETNKVQSAAKIAKLNLSGVTFKDENGDVATVTKAKILSVELLDTNGKVVAVADDLEKTYIETTIATAEKLDDVFKDEEALSGIAAGKYRLKINLDGYEAFTTNEFDLIDFQAATVSAEGSTAKKIVKTTLTGSLRYDDSTTIDEEVSIVVYDANGIVVGALYNNYTDSVDGVYEIIDGMDNTRDGDADAKLSAGTYTVVVRGKGFETLVKKVQLEANTKNVQDLVLTKHEGGRVKLSIYDSNNVPYGLGNVGKIWLLDENYVAFDDEARDKYDILDDVFASVNKNYYGKFAVDSTSEFEFNTNVSGDFLSKGSYTISIDETTLAKGNANADKVTIASIDATQYAIIVLDAKTNSKTIPLIVNFTAANGQVDWVVVKDSKGTIVAADDDIWDATEVSANATPDGKVTFKVEANDTYTVEVYSNGKFVGSEKVSVQDFSKTVSVTLDTATRD